MRLLWIFWGTRSYLKAGRWFLKANRIRRGWSDGTEKIQWQRHIQVTRDRCIMIINDVTCTATFPPQITTTKQFYTWICPSFRLMPTARRSAVPPAWVTARRGQALWTPCIGTFTVYFFLLVQASASVKMWKTDRSKSQVKIICKIYEKAKSDRKL